MTRGTVGLAALLALTAAPVAAQDSAKIGFVATFSGPAAAIGNDMRDAFELALDHLGRKVGGLPVTVVYEDDQQKPEVGKQKTDKLIESDRVNFLTGYIWSNVLLASLKPPGRATRCRRRSASISTRRASSRRS
jgi:branched-chain amino acid transport system substrate-binding protein